MLCHQSKKKSITGRHGLIVVTLGVDINVVHGPLCRFQHPDGNHQPHRQDLASTSLLTTLRLSCRRTGLHGCRITQQVGMTFKSSYGI